MHPCEEKKDGCKDFLTLPRYEGPFTNTCGGDAKIEKKNNKQTNKQKQNKEQKIANLKNFKLFCPENYG